MMNDNAHGNKIKLIFVDATDYHFSRKIWRKGKLKAYFESHLKLDIFFQKVVYILKEET